MDESAETLAHVIGKRVKQERRAKAWTLDQLAASAGVSRRMVVNIEQGTANPSVGTLLRLSDALGIGLPALVEQPVSPAARVTRHGEGAVLWTGQYGGRGVLLTGTESPNVVELWDWTLAPGDRHESEAHTHGTRELLHVQEGSLIVGIDNRTYELGAGDALIFHGDVPHAYSNPCEIPVRFTLAVFEPGVGNGH